MGFFDKIINKVTNLNVNNSNKNEKVNVSNLNSSSNNQRTNPSVNMKAHFDNILKSEFSQFNIQENVNTETINSSSAGKGYRPYSYVLYKGGRAAAAIMLTPHNRDNNKAFRGAKNACAKSGVPFINFYTHFPNERNYVINRIRSFI